MWKKIFICVLFVVLMVSLTACTSNTATRYYGGTTTVNLDPNTKFVDITWKESSLWILTKPMLEDDIAETYRFEEDSMYGIFEGTVIIKETKK